MAFPDPPTQGARPYQIKYMYDLIKICYFSVSSAHKKSSHRTSDISIFSSPDNGLFHSQFNHSTYIPA